MCYLIRKNLGQGRKRIFKIDIYLLLGKREKEREEEENGRNGGHGGGVVVVQISITTSLIQS